MRLLLIIPMSLTLGCKRTGTPAYVPWGSPTITLYFTLTFPLNWTNPRTPPAMPNPQGLGRLREGVGSARLVFAAWYFSFPRGRAIQAHKAQERCPWLDGAPWSLEERKARHKARPAQNPAGPMSPKRDKTFRSPLFSREPLDQ